MEARSLGVGDLVDENVEELALPACVVGVHALTLQGGEKRGPASKNPPAIAGALEGTVGQCRPGALTVGQQPGDGRLPTSRCWRLKQAEAQESVEACREHMRRHWIATHGINVVRVARRLNRPSPFIMKWVSTPLPSRSACRPRAVSMNSGRFHKDLHRARPFAEESGGWAS